MAPKITIQTAKKVVPIIYCYTTPEIARHDGWVKIGYSEQDAATRIGQQTHTVDVEYRLEWSKNATFDDGSGELFKDSDFHTYLTKCRVKRQKGTEWFQISPSEAKSMLDEFRENRGIKKADNVIPYKLRNEQQEAVDRARDYFSIHEHGEFLYNAKPRFGKTLTVYDLAKRMELKKVLIVTNRPAIANSWYEDYCKFLGADSGFCFVSEVDALKNQAHVLSRKQYIESLSDPDSPENCIEFVSLQDMKGSVYFGGQFNKLEEIAHMEWDMLVIDEAHEGVDTYKTDIAFDRIKRKYTLHLSGTPFKALANNKFPANAIYNWTYADEQKAKAGWKSAEGDPNPYENLPRLNMYTYQMSEIIREELSQGVEVNGETEEYAFDLNEFFATNERGFFVHNSSVDRFLNALTGQIKFPFSTPELREELKHTMWLLNRVDSAKALAKKLEKHPVFKDYKVILAAGDGRLDEDEEAQKSFDKVKEAISTYDKTITLSVGQLTTGVTIPEWTAVMMLSSIKSPGLYMQAAFRAQNPCLFTNGSEFFRKKDAYVFDFDPARTLIIFETFANDLSSDTSGGKGDTGTREDHVRELLNFFPVIGEDEDGEMIVLDAAKVLSIPRKIKSKEVVRRGFMSDFLFQNISNVFRAPQVVIDMIQQMDPAKDPGPLAGVTPSTGKELDINDDGEIQLPDEIVIGGASELFGEKIFDNVDVHDTLAGIIDSTPEKPQSDADTDAQKQLEQLKKAFKEQVTTPIIETATQKYGDDMSSRTAKKIESKINAVAESTFEHGFGQYQTERKSIEADRQNEIAAATSEEEVATINQTFDEKQKEASKFFKERMTETINTMVRDAGETVVRDVETEKKEKTKRTIEDSIKDHLRGFSRTIPSFLMAYGDDDTTLETFDKIIPDQVFIDVTSITLEQFCFLRDGGDYSNEETGAIEHFDGNLFDPIVFNDSVKEFLGLKVKLADYFDEANEEDIFDYIPSQKTNQIFTPKPTVKDMIDRLEVENPGCFDDPENTFVDLYMKSGMYITEIVKRLYQSERMKALYPDRKERLNHIFADQVYGLAPTEIIYRICLAYIMGFSNEVEIRKHNIKLCDALEYAKSGTLDDKLRKIFPELVNREVR
ncbi:MAG: DEAD/DEAH box helicase family protein [Negativicoccus succinicivorans]|uniref:DEAD/DEAH box helicase n=1 Tax=Negativicoccus succinicivorans TaxID=620903 RepID=UPI00291515CA|nr:DEAD/DEAH box helicase family protein [Negativicoccus succinicivorans]MDU5943714.1 DEAD/DEAH box helicase family protein [Negativicoccus succinicivorans]